jgi:hypothetical protein
MLRVLLVVAVLWMTLGRFVMEARMWRDALDDSWMIMITIIMPLVLSLLRFLPNRIYLPNDLL